MRNFLAILVAGALSLAPWGIPLSPARGGLFMSFSTVIIAINAQLLGRERLSYPDQVRVAADLQKIIS